PVPAEVGYPQLYPTTQPGGEPLPGAAVPARVGRLADGEWHRLHPASPLLKGGIAFIAILGVIVVNLRDIFIDLIFGGGGSNGGDPLVGAYENGFIGLGILGVIVVLLLCIGGFYLAWRMHTFRITAEVVEVR